jgi:hypothetical protein
MTFKEEMTMNEHEEVLNLMSELRNSDVHKFGVSLDADTNKIEVIVGFKPDAEINEDEKTEMGKIIFNSEIGLIPSEVFISDDGYIHATAEIAQIIHHKTT